jgi:phosphatidylinositol dimannoside acyltransferase
MIGVFFYKLGAFFARRIPQNVSESITEWLVKLQYLIRFRSRRIVRENLRIVLGPEPSDAEIRAIGRRVFSNFGRSIYYFLRLPFISAGDLKKRCDYNGLDATIGELAENGGCIFVGPHLGSWEVGGACLTALGIRLHTVALPHPSRRVTEFFNQRRELLGIECSPLRGSARSLRGALRDGKSVALLIDRTYLDGTYVGRKGVFQWFETDVELPMSHVALAIRSQAPIVTTVCVFDGADRFKFFFGGPHYPRRDLDYESAAIELQEQCVADMTRFVREFPDQWFHFQPFGGRPFVKDAQRHP